MRSEPSPHDMGANGYISALPHPEEEAILVAAPPVVPTPTTPTPVPPPVVDIDPEPVVEPEPTG